MMSTHFYDRLDHLPDFEVERHPGVTIILVEQLCCVAQAPLAKGYLRDLVPETDRHTTCSL